MPDDNERVAIKYLLSNNCQFDPFRQIISWIFSHRCISVTLLNIANYLIIFIPYLEASIMSVSISSSLNKSIISSSSFIKVSFRCCSSLRIIYLNVCKVRRGEASVFNCENKHSNKHSVIVLHRFHLSSSQTCVRINRILWQDFSFLLGSNSWV